MSPHDMAWNLWGEWNQIHLRERLKQFEFSRDHRIRLYGSQFELVGEPLVISENVVFVDAVECESRQFCRARIPLNILTQQKKSPRCTLPDFTRRITGFEVVLSRY